MPDLNIRNVDPSLVAYLKMQALKTGKTLRQYVINLLIKSAGGKQL